jgi:hypothetical protein
MNKEHMVMLVDQVYTKKGIIETYDYCGVHIEKYKGKLTIKSLPSDPGRSYQCYSMEQAIHMIEESYRIKDWERKEREFQRCIPIHISPAEIEAQMSGRPYKKRDK